MSRVVEDSSPLLEVIRRKEAEAKRQLAAEREAVEAALAEAERRARDLLAAAEVEGQRAGEAGRQAVLAEAERNAQAIVAQAQAEAEMLQRAGERQMVAAVARAFEIVIGGPHEA